VVVFDHREPRPGRCTVRVEDEDVQLGVVVSMSEVACTDV
jgi:hypothetical protein